MATKWFDSSATFQRSTAPKVWFILLSEMDLVLTSVAAYLGLWEINPFVRFLIEVPVLMLVMKLAIPILIAWLMPGRLLIPSIVLLALVVIWNISELVIFLV